MSRIAQREAAVVAAREARRPEAEVVLLGVLAVEAQPLAGAAGAARSAGAPAGAAPSKAPSTRPTSWSWSTLPAAATTMPPGT